LPFFQNVKNPVFQQRFYDWRPFRKCIVSKQSPLEFASGIVKPVETLPISTALLAGVGNMLFVTACYFCFMGISCYLGYVLSCFLKATIVPKPRGLQSRRKRAEQCQDFEYVPSNNRHSVRIFMVETPSRTNINGHCKLEVLAAAWLCSTL
jgi:hypothetical protein